MVDHQPTTDLSDELLACAARDDPTARPTAFGELYARYVSHIYRYLLSRVSNQHDAEDLTTQTFEAALQGIAAYRGQGAFAAWLTIIARNKAINYYRTHRNRPLDTEIDFVFYSPPLDDIIGQRLQISQILAALDDLNPERAEVIRLRIFGELSTAQTAQAMGKTEAAVKMLLYRALGDLRKRVGVINQVYEVDE
ncbi:MAG: sigma-70 family RNA polymerase sigma factor [Chitinophagaceae bacterium]|nr:sigma-70 family RNA polymerase sigma factor [Anaerolineae bacterium]